MAHGSPFGNFDPFGLGLIPSPRVPLRILPPPRLEALGFDFHAVDVANP